MNVIPKAWFRFSLRDLALTILLISIALAWFVDHQHLSGELSDAKPWRNRAGALEKMLKGNGWDIEYDSQYVNFQERPPRGHALTSFLAEACEPSEVVVGDE